MKDNRIVRFFAVLMSLVIPAVYTAEPLMAQLPATPLQATPQNPLVVAQSSSIYELQFPTAPPDKDILPMDRFFYGLTLIEQMGSTVVERFMLEYKEKVVGLDLYRKAVDLVLKFTGDRIKTDTIPRINWKPENVEIITTDAEIRRYTGLDPSTFKPILWRTDPFSAAPATKRSDMLETLDLFQTRLLDEFPGDADGVKKAVDEIRACLTQEGNSFTCKDMRVSELVNFQRNLGRGQQSVAQNEKYDPKTTNVPNAMATVMWSEGLNTWVGLGWECHNLLFFFLKYKIKEEINGRLVKANVTLSCEVKIDKKILTGLTDLTMARLTVKATPTPEPYDLTIRWFFNDKDGSRQVSANKYTLQVEGRDIVENMLTVMARVAYGDKPAECTDNVSLRFPTPPITIVPPETPPTRPVVITPPRTEEPKKGHGKLIGVLASLGGAALVAGLARGRKAPTPTVDLSKKPTFKAGEGVNP